MIRWITGVSRKIQRQITTCYCVCGAKDDGHNTNLNVLFFIPCSAAFSPLRDSGIRSLFFFFSHYYCFSLIYTVVLLLYPGILRVDAFNANHPLSLPLSLSPYTIYLGVQASAPLLAHSKNFFSIGELQAGASPEPLNSVGFDWQSTVPAHQAL